MSDCASICHECIRGSRTKVGRSTTSRFRRCFSHKRWWLEIGGRLFSCSLSAISEIKVFCLRRLSGRISETEATWRKRTTTSRGCGFMWVNTEHSPYMWDGMGWDGVIECAVHVHRRWRNSRKVAPPGLADHAHALHAVLAASSHHHIGVLVHANVNVRHRLHQDRLARRDLHDDGHAEIHAVRFSLFTAVRRGNLNGFKRDRHEASGAVDHLCLLDHGDVLFQVVDLVVVGGLQIRARGSLRVRDAASAGASGSGLVDHAHALHAVLAASSHHPIAVLVLAHATHVGCSLAHATAQNRCLARADADRERVCARIAVTSKTCLAHADADRERISARIVVTSPTCLAHATADRERVCARIAVTSKTCLAHADADRERISARMSSRAQPAWHMPLPTGKAAMRGASSLPANPAMHLALPRTGASSQGEPNSRTSSPAKPASHTPLWSQQWS